MWNIPQTHKRMNLYMYQNKITLLITLLLIGAINSFAQLNTSFSFGGILSNQKSITSYTGPMIVNGGSCYTVSNGVSALSSKDSSAGEFNGDCKVQDEPTAITYSCYPNPVTSYTTIITKGKVDYTKHYTLSVSNSFGQIVYHTTGTMDQLVNGKTISFEKYGIGFYVIRIGLENNTSTVFKVIKVN